MLPRGGVGVGGHLHNSRTKGTNSWFWLSGRTEHLYGATVAGKLKNCGRDEHGHAQDLNTSALTEFTDRSLLVAFSDVECVLEDGVHDPADAEGRLDDIGNNLLHCGLQIRKKTNKQTKKLSYPKSVLRVVLSGVKLTVQSLLESLHTHHVLGELEGLAVGLDSELSIKQRNQAQFC